MICSLDRCNNRRSEMKKTPVYWTGLVFVGLSVWALLFVLWGLMTMRGPISSGAFFPFAVFTTIGAVIFLLIGALMMKEGRETWRIEMRDWDDIWSQVGCSIAHPRLGHWHLHRMRYFKDTPAQTCVWPDAAADFHIYANLGYQKTPRKWKGPGGGS